MIVYVQYSLMGRRKSIYDPCQRMQKASPQLYGLAHIQLSTSRIQWQSHTTVYELFQIQTVTELRAIQAAMLESLLHWATGIGASKVQD